MVLSLGEHEGRTPGVERANDVVQDQVVSPFVASER